MKPLSFNFSHHEGYSYIFAFRSYVLPKFEIFWKQLCYSGAQNRVYSLFFIKLRRLVIKTAERVLRKMKRNRKENHESSHG